MLRARATNQLDSAYTPAEILILKALWSLGVEGCVRDIRPMFPGVAYTTLMTTLDRLFRKGTLTRNKIGRAFYYKPLAPEDQLVSRLTREALDSVLPNNAAEMRPIMSLFVAIVADRDESLLRDLEVLVRARRAELKRSST